MKLSALLVGGSLLIGCTAGGGGGDAENFDNLIPESGRTEYCTVEYETQFYPGPDYPDADKTGVDDDQMCWAAVAANLIVSAGYESNADNVFEYFKDHFENKSGYTYRALSFYFDQGPITPASAVVVREYRPDATMDFAVCGLHSGRAIALQLLGKQSNTRHMVSVAGYEYRSEDMFIIHYVDSNDGQDALKRLQVRYNYDLGIWESPEVQVEYAISLQQAR